MASELGGDLSEWRARASFSPSTMRALLNGGESRLSIMNEIWGVLEKEPLFKKETRILPIAEARDITHRRWKRLIELNFVTDTYEDYERAISLIEVLETYDQGLAARFALHNNVFLAAIRSMGTEKHKEIMQRGERNEIVGCFCLTELTHGSNSQGIQTTATWENGDLVIHTPHKGAMKVWAGNLALSANYAVVFAQLYVGGKCEGVHALVLQVRDERTHNTLPGVTIGDMGEKPGQWNSVENGWMVFDHFRVSPSCLLNKGCEITEDGRYVHQFKSDAEKKSVSLGALSIGRIGIVGKGAMACKLAATIAIRYSAVRKQFGPEPNLEIPVLHYPLQQRRLLPILASAISLIFFHQKLVGHFAEYLMRVMGGEKSDELMELSKEVHGLSSCAKPRATWLGVAALAEARAACGGHGFLHASRLNELRDTFDPSQTFEGENNMIIQQACNYLLAQDKEGKRSSPMGSIDFLSKQPSVYGGWRADVLSNAQHAYHWLQWHLLDKTKRAYASAAAEGHGPFATRNNSQIDAGHTLSLVYAEATMIDWAREEMENVEDLASKKVLLQSLTLFALHLLQNHLAILYIGGYCSGSEFGTRVKETQVAVEKALSGECVALVDALAPPDWALASALGHSDGRVYDRLADEFQSREFRAPFADDLSSFLRGRGKL